MEGETPVSEQTMDEVFALMRAAKDQQQAVDKALQGLASERAAIATDRAALLQAAGALTDTAAQVRKAAADTVPTLQKAAGAAVKVSLSGAADVAASALSTAAQPMVEQLEGAAEAVDKAKGKLQDAVASFGWKWAALAGGVAFSVLAVLLVAAWLLVEWQRSEVAELSQQRDALAVEVAQLQANAEAWSKTAARAELSHCGDKKRMCVRIDAKAGTFGTESDYAVIKGY